ncbi:MAG: DUF4010 domain-containing protein [Gammaproteobacteria bacterium]
MEFTASHYLSLAVALGIGLLIGAERERRKGKGPSRGPAGIRTFAITALLGALSLQLGGEIMLAVATAGVMVLTALAYFRSSAEDPGLTTEIALVITVLLGGWAVREPVVAAGAGVVVAILLSAREEIHRFVRDVLTEGEMRDALILLAATLVILPLVPDRYLGPYDALNPRTIWVIMILIMTISAAGHVAVRAFGPRYGLPMAGFFGGFVSSAATIGAMGGRALKQPETMRPAVAGAVLSTVATVLQMAAVLAATNPASLRLMTTALVLAGIAALGYGALFTIRAMSPVTKQDAPPGRAFNLGTAAVFALMFSVVLIAAAALREHMGQTGVVVAAAAAGFVDTHSAAASIASLVAAGKLAAADAVLPILAAFTTNTLTKMGFALVSGGMRFAMQIVPGLILVNAAAWLGSGLVEF